MKNGDGISVKFRYSFPELFTVKSIAAPTQQGGDATITATSGTRSLPSWMYIQDEDKNWTLTASNWNQ